MVRLLCFPMIVIMVGQPAWTQPVYRALPEKDYAVYAALANHFARCDDPEQAHLRNSLWLVSSVTETQSDHGFRFNFNETPAQLAWRFPKKDSFAKRPDWVSFLTSVDGGQFTQYELKKRPEVACRKLLLWTRRQMDDYFKSGNRQVRGYEAINRDYPGFGALIHFSKVAFSSDGTKALCYFSQTSGGLAGEGFLVFLENKESKWEVIDFTQLWVA